MNWLIYHFASGTAFFSGAVCVLIAAGLSTRDRRWIRRVAVLTALIGVLLIAVSATPLSVWYYLPAAGIALVWLVLCDARTDSHRRRMISAALLGIVMVLGVVLELPYHVTPSLAPGSVRTVIIFGDSVTAGIGEDEAETWPLILARTRSLIVHDYSQMGATASSALKTARKHKIPDGVVLLEIGGNDLLGSTTPPAFRRDLDALLHHVTGDRKQIVMLELPLPPFRNAYGWIQRDLSQKYDVMLVPKRIFMRVLTRDQATLDSIHLSQLGHELMAEAMWEAVGSAFEPIEK